jgi:uncharacterized protein YfaS (alpha-2-macroglobulin family)
MRKLVSWIVFLAIYAGIVAPFAAPAQVTGRAMETKMKDVPPGLQFVLSEGQTGAETRTTQPPSQADPLSQAESGDLLKRLPPIKTDLDDQTDFAKRLGTLPAPKTGQRIPVKFPSEDDRGTPKIDPGKTLEVIRYSPEGEVKLAPDLNVTFSQPMVAVTSQEQAAQYAPVQLSPQVEGRWRWLGTKTLMFDTDKRFPMATKYTAHVPAGTKAANGQVLGKDFNWTFTTPPPSVVRKYPEGQVVRRDALIYVSFDQEIDPAAVLRTTTVSAGDRKLRTRLATPDEIASGPLGDIYKEQPGRWMVLRVVNTDGSVENAMPGASTITVTVEKGTHSAEGPLTTNVAQSFSFTTYGPMKFVNGRCGYDNSIKSCSPFADWYLEFKNPIDSSKFSKELVKIEPPLEGVNIYPSGNYIYVQGYKKGRTAYKVTVDGALADIFGQTLGQSATATFNVGSADANLYSQGGTMAILDPSAAPTFSIYSTNHASVKVRVYSVTPSDWYQFQQYVRRINYDDDTQRPAIPGRLVIDRTVSIKNIPDELVETRIDLSEGLDGGYGNVIVDIQPTVKKDRADRTRIFKWLQATQIGLDAFVDNSELVGFATELRTGKPLSGVELSIFPNGNAVSQAQAPEQPGLIEEAWNWLTGWGSDQANHIDALNGDGSVATSSEVEPAASNVTASDGILRLPLPETASGKGQNVLIARRGKDIAFLPENADYYWQDAGTWYKKPDTDSLRWFVFDDRGIYKPKEDVTIKGYIRRVTGGKLGDIEGLNDLARTVNYSIKDPRGNEIGKGSAALNPFGAFDFKFKLPDNTNLGYARVDLDTESRLPGHEYSHPFQIQEFRRPEFEVTTKVESEAPFFVGDSAMLSVEAKYYAGGGLPSAETNWTVTATPTNYTPPNRDDYVFGVWVPWWRGLDYSDYNGRGYYGGKTETFKGVTDASGKHVLKIDFQSVNPPRPYAISASASVQDVNRQAWAGQTSLLVHPSSLYVGIKTPRTFVQKGDPINVNSIVTDIDGKIAGGRDVEIKAVLKDWEFDKGSWQEKIVDEQSCTVKSSDEAQLCSFIAKQGGRYTLTATVIDDRERYNQSELTVWVPGGKMPPSRNVEQQEVQIIPSKKDYAPGETAELLVIAPFTPAEGVLTLRRDGIVKTERFTMTDSSATLKIPIDEKYLPNIYAQVDLVGAAARTNDKGEVDSKLATRPAFATANLNLNVLTVSRRLNVSAEPRDKTLVPGGETKVDVAVKDSKGNAVSNSEVAVVVVDESVLALTRYSIADPISVFYTDRSSGTVDYHSRSQVLLANPGDLKLIAEQSVGGSVANTVSIADGVVSTRQLKSLPAPMASRAKMAMLSKDAMEELKVEPDVSINLRQNFNALALFSPSVKTDADGRAVIDIKLPDNLTRYRITAVSVDDAKRFGKSDSTITAKQPLMVRPSAPRFMNFGDRIELPVVVQNQTDQDMAVNIAIRATNAALISTGDLSEPGAVATGDLKNPLATAWGSDTLGRRVIVKANDRAEVRFPVAAVKAGTARFQIAVTSGKFSDAAEISLPVWTPATTEAFATYGTTDQNGAILQPIETPADVFPQFGGLEVTTSSTQLQELTDAFLQLYHYPFDCSEQISSRMISVAALRDVLTAFKSKDMPTADEINASFTKDIAILKARQRDDGSFGLWTRDRERYEYPFLTVHVAHALILAKMKGYNVPDEMLNKTKPYLKDIESHFDDWYKNAPQVRWTISAYALYVRDLMGDKDTGKAKKLLAEMKGGNPSGSEGALLNSEFGKAPFEALGWILSVLATDPNSKTETDSIVRFLMNRTTETAATANFVTDYGDGAWLIMYSNRRADGVLLEALIKADPNNDLIPKLVRGLLDHRVKGAWGSTQENVFILLALDKYFNTFEKVTPDFVSRIWLGNAYAGEQTFRGRSIDSNVLDIPMSYLTEQNADTSNLIIDKQGPGRLYYRIGMKYAPKNLKLDPADYGFTVLRSYEPVDNADDVKQNSDGSWTIKSGARVRVRLTMVAQARRYHVALVDNLPAGLEILNPGLATTEAVPADAQPATSVLSYGSRSIGGGSWWWRQNWFEHQNFRDERAEAFCSLLWEGVYNYSYVARATTPGQFVVPPAKAEEMYHPETFGRTGTDNVNIQ